MGISSAGSNAPFPSRLAVPLSAMPGDQRVVGVMAEPTFLMLVMLDISDALSLILERSGRRTELQIPTIFALLCSSELVAQM